MSHDAHRNSLYSQPNEQSSSSSTPYPPSSASYNTYDSSQYTPASASSPYPAPPGVPDPRYHHNTMSPGTAVPNGTGPVPRYDSMNVPPPPPPPPPLSQSSMPPSYNVASSPPPQAPGVPHSQAAPHLYNAINSAFDSSAAANQVPSDLISQITEQVRTQVIDSLRAEFASKAAAEQQQQQQHYQQPLPNYQTSSAQQHQSQAPLPYPTNASNPSLNIPMPQQSNPMGQSQGGFFSPGSAPSATASVPLRAVHTPPTPNPGSGGESDEAQHFFGEKEESRSTARRMGGRTKSDFTGANASATGVPMARPKEDLTGRFGERQREDKSRERPPPTRSMTDEEETVVEKMWQPLFDEAGMPTARLGQVLRGLALHLIEDLEPKNSMVVGPKKMKRFYEMMKVSDEAYPWAGMYMSKSQHYQSC
jgi:hypothetical protein